MPPVINHIKVACTYGQKCSIVSRELFLKKSAPPQGRVMPQMKCEDPINKLTVQVWLLYHRPNSFFEFISVWFINILPYGENTILSNFKKSFSNKMLTIKEVLFMH